MKKFFKKRQYSYSYQNNTSKDTATKSTRFSNFTPWKRVLFLIVVSAVLIFAAYILRPYTYYTFDSEPLDDYTVYGVDVSSYQGNMDWNTLYKQGVSFAFIKATEGSSIVDSQFENNWSNIHQTPIKYSAYHFVSFDSSGEDQAKNYISTVGKTDYTLPPVVDVELYGDYLETLPDQELVTSILTSLLESLEDYYGVTPIIYTNRYFYSIYIDGVFDNPIWIASPDNTDSITDETDWEFLQYSFYGQLDGYDGISDIDLNVYNGDINELIYYNYDTV